MGGGAAIPWHEHEMDRPEDYMTTSLPCVGGKSQSLRHVISWYSDYGKCVISHCESVHSQYKKETNIRKELRQRGITLHPDSDPVARLPAGALWTVKDVKRVFQKTLSSGFLYPTL